MSRLIAILNLLRKGSVIANPEAWKYGQITATALGGFLWAGIRAAESFGIVLPLDAAQVDQLAAGLLVLVNVVLTLVTSDKVGLPPSPKSVDKSTSADERSIFDIGNH